MKARGNSLNDRIWKAALTALLVFTAMATTLFIMAALYGLEGDILPPPFAAVGRFFADSFSWMALFVPAFLIWGAGLLQSSSLNPSSLGVWALSLFPFLTASALVRLFAGPASFSLGDRLVERFGRPASAFGLFSALTIEVVGLAVFSVVRRAPVDRQDDGDDGPEAEDDSRYVPLLGSPEEAAGFVRDGLDLPSLASEAPTLADDQFAAVGFTADDAAAEVEARADYPAEARESEDESPLGEAFLEQKPPFATEEEAENLAELEEVVDPVAAAPKPEPRQIESKPAETEPEQAEAQAEAEPKAPRESAEPPQPVVREKAPPKKEYVTYSVPVRELLNRYDGGEYWVIDEHTRESADILKNTLEEFKISAEVTGIRKGPVITMFEILPAPGVKLSRITNLADNIALRLAAQSVRIVAPIPGKHAVGIEVPNKKRSLVSFQEMLESDTYGSDEHHIPMILGKDITGNVRIVDLVQTPHLLIAGATGSGKSVCVNSLICSILYKRTPEEVRLMLIDPKIVELKLYNDIPHLMTPVITDPKKAFQALQYCLYEMERRYALLDTQGARDIRGYNKKVKERRLATKPLPYIVVIVDEFADLMATSGKELEATLARLAAMSRAVGIHLVLATQRPSIDVITGLIKANIPSRIAFMVAGKFDSRIIIDGVGAEKLLGKGDMLFTSAWDPNPQRIQGAFLSEEEVSRVADYVRTLGEPDYLDDEIFLDEEEDDFDDLSGAADDPLMDKALEIVVAAGKASASYLQRRLKVGYNRAARLVEEMERRGIVGPQNGSKPRELLHVPDMLETADSNAD